MKYGYARVSTEDQDLAVQLAALEEVGCESVFRDEVAGAGRRGPAFDRCLEVLRSGDTLIVWRLDRLGRRLRGLAALLDELEQRGIRFISLGEAIDTGTREGRAILRTIGALAASEHAETAARRWGRRVQGRRRWKVTPEQVAQARGLFEGDGRSLAETAGIVGIATTTLRSALERAGVEVKRGKTKTVTPEMLARARGLLKEGMNGVEIGAVIGVRPSALYVAFRRAGVRLAHGKRRKLTPALLARARARIEQGETQTEVARSMGVSGEGLRAAFLRDRIEIRYIIRPKYARGPKVTPEMLARARKLIEQGDSKAAAAGKIGVGTAALRTALLRAGVTYWPARRVMTPVQLARAWKLLAQGMTQAEVARTIGVGESTLSRILKVERERGKIPRDGP